MCTREFGRGTDFKYHGDLVIHAGGLHVIQAFFTEDYSEEIQIRGRTRRQGTTGSYEIIASKDQILTLTTDIKPEFVDSLFSFTPREIYSKLDDIRKINFASK